MNQECYYRISVKAISFNAENKILLSREDNGKWELLGGGLNHNESPIDCLVREVYEETKLRITHVSTHPLYLTTSPRLGYDSYIANVIYEVKLENLDFSPSEECQELKYFDAEEAKKLDLFPNVESLLKVFDPKIRSNALNSITLH